MENGLREYFAQNYNYIAGTIVSAFCFLFGVITKLRIKYDSETKKRSEERFKSGEKEFGRLEEGQESIEEKIERWEEKAEVQREEIKNSVGKIEGRLSVLENDHKRNHK